MRSLGTLSLWTVLSALALGGSSCRDAAQDIAELPAGSSHATWPTKPLTAERYVEAVQQKNDLARSYWQQRSELQRNKKLTAAEAAAADAKARAEAIEQWKHVQQKLECSDQMLSQFATVRTNHPAIVALQGGAVRPANPLAPLARFPAHDATGRMVNAAVDPLPTSAGPALSSDSPALTRAPAKTAQTVGDLR